MRFQTIKNKAISRSRPIPICEGVYPRNKLETVKQAHMSEASEVATAGSDGTQQPQSRFRISPRGNLTRKLVTGKPGLNKLDLRLVDLMVYGVERSLPHWPEVAPGVPLTAMQAGDMLRLRRSYVRDLLKEPLFQKAMAQAVNDLRTGAKARAMHRIISLVDEPGEGKAADRKVQLEASRDVLDIKAGGISVNVAVQNNTNNINPGYVIRDPRSDAPTIEGTVNEADSER